MENPFESGHIKNYILAYSSIVVIMVLFFIASTLFNDVKEHDAKVFLTESNGTEAVKYEAKREIDVNSSRFRLMKTSY